MKCPKCKSDCLKKHQASDGEYYYFCSACHYITYPEKIQRLLSKFF